VNEGKLKYTWYNAKTTLIEM